MAENKSEAHGLGPHAVILADQTDGFMDVALLIGECVYLQQADSVIFLSQLQARALLARLATPGAA